MSFDLVPALNVQLALRQLMSDDCVGIRDIAARAEVSSASLYRVDAGIAKSVRLETVEKIAAAFNRPLTFFTREPERAKDELDAEEQRMIYAFRSLCSENRELVLRLAEALAMVKPESGS